MTRPVPILAFAAACTLFSALGGCALEHQPLLNLTVNISRVVAQLDDLSNFNDAELPSVTRVLYTKRDVEAREHIRKLIVESGLLLREDAVGNIFARFPASDDSTASDGDLVGTGSHYDAIPESGMYDGTVGVLGGLEAVRALRESGFRPRRGIEVLAFTSEEPTRFGMSCIGSRLLVGQLAVAALRDLHDEDGISFDEARGEAGITGNLSGVLLPENYYAAFVELHIEQGKVLEDGGYDIGIVTAIAGPASADATFEGDGGHAGGVLMSERHDAVLAGAEFALAAERAALSTGSADTVATSGVFSVEPGAENSIGRRVRVSLDVRDVDGARRDGVLAACGSSAAAIASRRGVAGGFRVRSRDAPARCAPAVVAAAEDAARRLGYRHRRLVSRAYHDALLMARRFPTGMVFIPCREGISHHWREHSSAEQMEKGILTLAHALAALAGGGDSPSPGLEPTNVAVPGFAEQGEL